MPFAGYEDFADCVRKNADKDRPEAFCAWVEHQATGKWPSEMTALKELYARRVENLEIFRVGTFSDREGQTTAWTEADLDSMVAAFINGVPGSVPVKLGHTSAEFNAAVASRLGVPIEVLDGNRGDGQARLGEVADLRRDGDTLVASLLIHDAVAPLLDEGFFVDVSAEIFVDYQGYRAVLSGLALLGAERPAIADLAGLAGAQILSSRKPDRVFAFKMSDRAKVVKEQVVNEIEVRKLLGLDETGDILAAVGALKTKADRAPEAYAFVQALGAKEPGEAMVALRHLQEEIKAKSDSAVKMQEQVGHLTTEVAAMKREARVKAYREAVVGLKALEGTAEKRAERLMAVEEKMGEPAAKELLADWQKAEQLAAQAGVLKGLGQTGNGIPAAAKHLFQERAEKLAAERKITAQKARAQLALDDPALFDDYQDFMKAQSA